MPPPPIRIPGGLRAPTPADVAPFVPPPAPPPAAPALPPAALVDEPLGFDVRTPLGLDVSGVPAPALEPARVPRFLAGPTPPPAPSPVASDGPYASEPRLSHGDTTPRVGGDFYIPPMPSGLVVPRAPTRATAPPALLEHVAGAARATPRLRMMPRSSMPVAPPPVERDSLGRPLDPGAVDDLTRARGVWREPQETPYDRERRAIGIARDLEVARGEMLARQGADLADVEEGYRQRVESNERDRQAMSDQARQSMTRAADRLAGMHVDPSRYWRSNGGFGIIGNAIAVGLGAMGEALGGGPNQAVTAIQSAIDRDIAAQERDASIASEDVQNRRGILHEVQREFAARDAAILASRSIMLRDAAARAEAEGAMMGSREAQANAIVLRDRLLSQAEADRASAEAAEVSAQLELRERIARLRSAEARALRDERRAMGGAARPANVTSAQWSAYRDGIANGVPTAMAAQAAGIPQHLWSSLGGSPVTTEQRSALDALDSTLRTIEDGIAAGDASGDIEGVGVVDRALPTAMQSDQGLVMRTAIASAIDLLGRLRSGAAISADEEERFRAMFEGAGTERELRVGVAQMRRELAARLGLGGRRQSGSSAADAAISDIGMTRVE